MSLNARLIDIFRPDLPIYYLITNLVELQSIDRELKEFIESEYKENFLGSIPKREHLRKTIYRREPMVLNEDYYKAYEKIVENFLNKINL